MFFPERVFCNVKLREFGFYIFNPFRRQAERTLKKNIHAENF